MNYRKMTTCFVSLVFACLISLGSAADKDKKIVVNLERQKLLAYEGAEAIYEFDCVTGRAGKETEPGQFKVLRKVADYTSKKYKVPMPHSLFFSDDGKAIHGTQWAKVRSYAKAYISDSVGSHGCVGLSPSDAEKLYKWAQKDTEVQIVAK